MAKIIINKGFLSKGGQFYKAGEIVTIADSSYAKRIVARSGGDFDFYHEQEIPANGEDETPTTGTDTNPAADGEDETPTTGEDGENGAGGVSDSDNLADDMGLPAIDADAAVQTKNTKGKKK